jgi:hypothetical protein
VGGGDAVDVVLGDLTVRLRADEALAAYVAARFTTRAPSGEPAALSDVSLVPRAAAADGRRGRRVWESNGMIWCAGFPGMPELTVSVCRDAPLRVAAHFYRSTGRRLYKRLVAGLAPHALLEQLTHYTLLYPALLAAEQRGRFALHGGAVAHNSRALVLAGLPGAGKSTLSTLLQRRGYTLLADNIVMLAGDQVWALPEPVKLDLRSRELVSERRKASAGGTADVQVAAADQVEGSLSATYGRKAVRLAPQPGGLPLAALVLAVRGSHTRLDPHARLTAGALLDLNRLAYELHGYYLYRAFARMALGRPPVEEYEALAATVSAVPVARLTVADDDVARACDALEELL